MQSLWPFDRILAAMLIVLVLTFAVPLGAVAADAGRDRGALLDASAAEEQGEVPGFDTALGQVVHRLAHAGHRPEPAGTRARFAIVLDKDATARVGGALTMMPPDGIAKEAEGTQPLEGEPLQNATEVMNIMAALFHEAGAPHIVVHADDLVALPA